MIIYPAVDIKDGKVVRLLQGRMENATEYSDYPADVAADYEARGAKYLHLVDLNGAFSGEPVNDRAIREIIANVSLQIQAGGGIRTLARIEELLELGVSRVILGTAAVQNPYLVEEAVCRYGERIVVGIDAKDGMVAVQGWAERTDIKAEELGRYMKETGVSRIIFTDISRDGMLGGPNIAAAVSMAEASGLSVTVSGGVSSLDDLMNIKKEAERGISLEGIIIGKALYSGAFSLEEALEAVGK